MHVLFDQGTPIGIRQSLREHTREDSIRARLEHASEWAIASHGGGSWIRGVAHDRQQSSVSAEPGRPETGDRRSEQEQVEAYSKRASADICGGSRSKARKLHGCRNTGDVRSRQNRKNVYGFTFSAELLSGGSAQCSTHLEAKNSISTFLCFIFPTSSGATIRDCGPSARLKVH